MKAVVAYHRALARMFWKMEFGRTAQYEGMYAAWLSRT